MSGHTAPLDRRDVAVLGFLLLVGVAAPLAMAAVGIVAAYLLARLFLGRASASLAVPEPTGFVLLAAGLWVASRAVRARRSID